MVSFPLKYIKKFYSLPLPPHHSLSSPPNLSDMSRRGPPCIGGKAFKPSTDLSLRHLPSLCIPGPGAGAVNKLESLGWNGKVVAYLSLSLANDNRSISNGNFNLIGSISEQPLTFPAKKIWNTTDDNVSLQLSIPDGRNFIFSEGGLTSDYLDGNSCKASFFTNTDPANPTLIQGEDLEARGVGDFCLRAYATPQSPNLVKMWILIFPSSAEEVLSHPLGRNPAWPGILAFSGQVPLFPPSSSLSLPWGQPILPLFIIGGSLETLPYCPSSQEISSRTATILRTCSTPDYYRTGALLIARWRELDEDGAAKLISPPLEKIWPAPPTSSEPPPIGRPCFSYPMFYVLFSFGFATPSFLTRPLL